MADDAETPPLPEGYERAPQQAQAVLPPPPPGYERAPESKPGMLESFGRGAAEGATFGFEDKLGMSKEAREASRAANPWSHFLGELAGGLAPMAAAYLLPSGVGQAAAVGRTANLLREGAGLARAALVPGEIASTAGALGQGAKLGATYGALSGAGHAAVDPSDSYAEAAKNRLMGGLGGGAEGAAFGTALGGAGRLLFRTAQGIGTRFATATDENAPGGRGAIVAATKRLESDRITPQEIMANIQSEFPDATQTTPGGPGRPIARRFWGNPTLPTGHPQGRQPWTQQQVEDVVGQAMAGNDAASISSSMQQAMGGTGPGPQAVQTLLDELAQRHLGPLNIVDRAALIRTGSGENTQMGMRVAAATPGEATANAREALLGRQLGTNDRIHQMLDRMVGSTDYDGAAAAHQAQMDAAADRLYGAARQNEKPFNLNPVLDQWRSRFANQRGPIPDAVNSAIDQFATPSANWQQTLSGALKLPGMPPVNAPTAAMQQAVTQAQKQLNQAQAALNKWTRAKANKGQTPPAQMTQAVTDAQQQLGMAQQVASQANIHPITPGTPPNAAPVGLDAFTLARQGLTDRINREYIQTPQGLQLSQLGRTLGALKTQLTNEVRNTNPDWALANDTFREGAAGNEALTAGSKTAMRLNAGTRENLSEFADAQAAEARANQALNAARNAGDQAGIARAQAMLDGAQTRQQLFRVGFVRSISDQIMNKGETEDLVRQMLFPGARQVITRVLGDQAPQFINQLRAEAAMLRTYRAQFGSQTTPLREAIAEDSWAPRFEVSMTNPMTWANAALRLAQEHAARTINANRNTELMRLYTNQNPLDQLGYLRAMAALHRTRSNAGNIAGLPVVGSAAPLSETTVASQFAPPPKSRQ